MISYAEALTLILREAHGFGTEKITLEKSFGRVLAEDVRADRDYPPFNRSAMDGFAVHAAGLSQGKEYPIVGTIFAGDKVAKKPYAAGTSVKIMTGAALPPGFDAVVRKEDAIAENGLVRFSTGALQRWHNVSVMGEDLKRGTALSLAGSVIDRSAVTTLASLGVTRPLVKKLPRVAILTTGDEIVPPGRKPQAQQIRNSNIFALRALLAAFGIEKVVAKHAADNEAALTAALRSVLGADIVLLTGGVSAGDADYVPGILTKLKVKEVFHKTAIKPGKPLWFGTRGKTLVFGIPGNPWSSQVVFKIYIEPYLCHAFGMEPPLRLSLPLAKERNKKDTLQHFFPVRVANRSGSASELEALSFNGSGDIRAGLGSDGLAVHPAHKKELKRGDIVEFIPW
ncbi:MAG: molybdopterin molybdotransferase MoeA [Spirochaetes bacterium]|nr:molybdopterin molybdotransferase MoeA [Spirochaetota bacterium]